MSISELLKIHRDIEEANRWHMDDWRADLEEQEVRDVISTYCLDEAV